MNEFYDLESQYVGRPPLNLSHADSISPTCYDGMWTFAYALNSTIAGNNEKKKLLHAITNNCECECSCVGVNGNMFINMDTHESYTCMCITPV